jgi:uncharacterized damage-inducible protein DinB
MSVSASTIRSHLDYTAWASGLLLDAARELSPEELNRDFQTADKSVLGTLVHIFAGDRIWLERVQGLSRERLLDPGDQEFVALQHAWPRVYQGWKDWAASATDTQVLEDVSFYRSATGSMFQMPAWQIVMHVVNHGTQHRGAVLGFLRAMGKTPPKLDLMAYYFAKPAASSAAS